MRHITKGALNRKRSKLQPAAFSVLNRHWAQVWQVAVGEEI